MQSFLPSLVNRLTVFPLVAVLAVLILRRWRGGKAFTMRCVKCGTPFCRRCHLGAVAGGLCTQCHHLFMVRDGVSGPARNQKLLEVQKEDERRGRIFRLLSIVSPGAGHVYAQRVLVGFLIVFFWYAVIALTIMGGRFLPFTEVSGTVARPWDLFLAAALLLVTFIMANRLGPGFDFLAAPRRAPAATARRGRVA